MPILKWFPPQGQPRTFLLYKPVTTIGRALGNDVAIPSHGLAETHAQVLFDGRDFNLEEVDKHAEILINGKKKRRARLVHGDRLTLGDVELSFGVFDEPRKVGRPLAATGDIVADAASAAISDTQLHVTNQQLAGLRKLYEFSEKLMTMKDIDRLLEGMLDAVIEVTGAEKGLILLNEDAFTATAAEAAPDAAPGPKGPVIRASRNVKGDALTHNSGGISDSIVRKDLETGRPLIVSDARSDSQLKASE